MSAGTTWWRAQVPLALSLLPSWSCKPMFYPCPLGNGEPLLGTCCACPRVGVKKMVNKHHSAQNS